MPGPSNIKKKRKPRSKSQKRGKQANTKPPPSPPSRFHRDEDSSSPLSSSPIRLLTPRRYARDSGFYRGEADEPKVELECEAEPLPIPQRPFIHDPGNGPRVRDTRAFLESKFFAQPPALDIPLCAEFAQEEVLQMLMTVLPEEIALILWYNKSRATSRICPACQRLYRLGDVLPDHLDDGTSKPKIETRPSPQLEREQTLSGLCSPVCFVVASFNYPGAIRSAWGRAEDELDDHTWALLNGPEEGNALGDVGMGLGMLMKMTRLHDLGLAQLCLGLDVEDMDDYRTHVHRTVEVSIV
ncbi:hypothetical protein LshimejAT787_1702360 [Lyophyllum shimeji]|uniref:Uncharacterized protein n=1 Tax=Lyophyllum shimeji TaxID=47721 RepID=A0A9P3Q013_LYOSH|nr:hypothetical protein LshimejAT787_1702360 [Lyophyllum shimeji]